MGKIVKEMALRAPMTLKQIKVKVKLKMVQMLTKLRVILRGKVSLIVLR